MIIKELEENVIRRREIATDVLSKLINLINKKGPLSVNISTKVLEGIPTINFVNIMDKFLDEVHLKIFSCNNGMYPTEVESGNVKEKINLQYFEVINIINYGEVL